jgi:cellulose synthase/poly-beta-1,6-N-acetylglucosamine synthase-like glycosyltransferase
MMVWQILFWTSVGAIAFSYLLYPFILWIISKLKRPLQFKTYASDEDLPTVSIVMAAYNEELILNQKIESIFNTKYPLHNIELLIGSDNSTDGTNKILEEAARQYPQIRLKLFTQRQGKISIINQLQQLAQGELLIVTDANVLFNPDTLPELIAPFADDRVGLVDTHMTNYGMKSHGISVQEKSYISREVYIKHLESINFGTMIGPFGGCYAIRNKLFTSVPTTYLVDDFFICMNVLDQKKMAINNLNARVSEDVSNDLGIEFKRKIRIGTGNFQNLKHFAHLLWPPFRAVSFCFVSHKVLRWLGPFFILGAFVSNAVLASHSTFYLVLFGSQLCVTILPLLDFIARNIGIHIVLLRFATHFYTMNLSLLIGFFKLIKGVKTNVWKPTKRLQE